MLPLNLPVEQYSHGLRQRVAVEVARSGFGSTVEIIDKTTAAKIGKRQAEELAHHSAIDFEEFYQQQLAQSSDEASDSSSLFSYPSTPCNLILNPFLSL